MAKHKLVIKIGSSSLTNSQAQLDLKNLRRIVKQTANLVKKGQSIVLVTSGAIVCGAQVLKLGKPKTIPQKQAAAAVGQSRLMRQYEKAFEKYGIPTAQILLTRDAITNPDRYANARNCFQTLLNEGVVPIVNENDTVAVDEIKIGDNDNLAALTAELIGAKILILLTDVDGFYMKDQKGKLKLVSEIKEINAQIETAAGTSSSDQGTGGMKTKLQAAKLCQRAGINMYIINSRRSNLIQKAANREKVGTRFIV